MKHRVVDVVAEIVGFVWRRGIFAWERGGGELEKEFESCSRTAREGESKFEDGWDQIAESVWVVWT